MWKLIIIGVLVIIPILLFKFKIKIHLKSFLSKGFRPKRTGFGTYCFSGKQGSGKTTALVSYLYDNKDKIYVISNIHSIKLKGLAIEYFSGLSELNDYKDKLDNPNSEINARIGGKQVIFVYDELFQELMRGSRVDKRTMDFLSQMRKRHVIFLTTCQDWAELPITYRKMCRYQIDCKMIPLFFSGLILRRYRDAENMKWDETEQDFVAPLVKTEVEHTRLSVVKCFDTLEKIKS